MFKSITILGFMCLFFLNQTHAFVVSSSPTGKYILISDSLDSELLIIYDREQDVIVNRIIFHKNEASDSLGRFIKLESDVILLGWKNETSFYYIYEGCVKYLDVLSGKRKTISTLRNNITQLLKNNRSTIYIPPYYKNSNLFIILIQGVKVLNVDLFNNRKYEILDLEDHFDQDVFINFLSVSADKELLFNIQYKGKSKIYFTSIDDKTSKISLIEESNKISIDSYCFFFKFKHKILYYRYNKLDDDTKNIEIVEFDLKKMREIKCSTLPLGCVPSHAVDIPHDDLFLINCINFDDYSTSVNSLIHQHSDVINVLINIYSNIFGVMMNNFTVFSYQYE